MKPLHLEVLYSGDHNLSCYYMAEVVKVVASTFPKQVWWEIVYIFKKEGARRFYELSVALYGEGGVKKNHCLAPVPSLFIDGRLVYDRIPPVEELADTVRWLIREKGLDDEKAADNR